MYLSFHGPLALANPTRSRMCDCFVTGTAGLIKDPLQPAVKPSPNQAHADATVVVAWNHSLLTIGNATVNDAPKRLHEGRCSSTNVIRNEILKHEYGSNGGNQLIRPPTPYKRERTNQAQGVPECLTSAKCYEWHQQKLGLFHPMALGTHLVCSATKALLAVLQVCGDALLPLASQVCLHKCV